MQTLLSTRIFGGLSLNDQVLRLVRDRGLVRLELDVKGAHVDLRSVAEVRMLRRRLETHGLVAPWIRLDEGFLRRLGQDMELAELTAAVVAAGAEAVVLPPPRDWEGPGVPPLAEVVLRIRQTGSRPILLARPVDAPDIDRYPWLSVCWDLAFGEGEEEEMRRQVKEAIEGMERRRLAGVRIARLRDGRRDVPLEPQAALLERAWPELAPTPLVYDVDPPGAPLMEVARALDEIRAFHLGEKRPPGQRKGGLFWAAVAPG